MCIRDRFKVGRSNITYKIFDDSNVLVLRRPPFGNKLESAHNMQREFRIITELSKNNLKVPKPILLCVDRLICVDDFYIMEYIEGETIADNLISTAINYNLEEALGTIAAAAPTLAKRLVDIGLSERTRPYTAVDAIKTSLTFLQSGVIDRVIKSEIKKIRIALEQIEGEPSEIVVI